VWVFGFAFLSSPIPIHKQDKSEGLIHVRLPNQDVDIANVTMDKALFMQAPKTGCQFTADMPNSRELGQVREWGIVLGYVFHDDHKPLAAINFIDSVEFWRKTKLTMGILRMALTELDVQVFIRLLIEVLRKTLLFSTTPSYVK